MTNWYRSITSLRNVRISRFIGLIKEILTGSSAVPGVLGPVSGLVGGAGRGSGVWEERRGGQRLYPAAAQRDGPRPDEGEPGFSLNSTVALLWPHAPLLLTLRDRRCCWSCRTSRCPSSTPLTTPSCTLSQSAASACGEWGGASAGETPFVSVCLKDIVHDVWIFCIC